MKKNIFSIFTIGAVLLFSGCTDKLENEFVPKNSGDEIVFGARATYELNEDRNKAPETRTVYTGEFLNSDGETWKNGDGAKYEGVKWIAGDQVRIFCPDAAGRKTADYTVTLSGTQQEHVASLTRNANYDGALQWGDTNSTHHFYAVYPAPSQYTDGPVAGNVLNNDTKLKGTIPAVQPHLGSSFMKTASITTSIPAHDGLQERTVTGTNHIVAPNMEYAYMVARRDVVPNETTDEIYLNFVPVATAVEITIQNVARNSQYQNGEVLYLTNVLVSSSSTPIYGDFSVDLAALNEDGSAIDSAKEPFETGTSTGNQISVPMFQDGIYGDPIQLPFGDAITFTVFMLPTVGDLASLDIVVQALGGTKSGHLNGIQITQKKKTYIKNLPFVGKNLLPFTQSEWLRFIENEVAVKDLSIPGAGGAASGDLNGDGSYALADINRQQNLSIEGLWNKGVRCFEFATDIPSDGTSSLGYQQVICNGLECGVTLDAAIDDVVEQLNAHPQEFAMVILTYQTLGGWSARKPATYMNLLNTYWPTVKSKLSSACSFGEYSTDSKVGDSRGKLFCIARPTSIHQDYGPAVVTPQSSWWGLVQQFNPSNVSYESLAIADPVDGIVVINGWGALKDKWQQRGYIEGSYRQNNNLPAGATKPGRPFDVSTIYNGSHSSLPSNTIDGETWRGNLPDESYSPGTLTPDFSYTTSTGVDAWVQEWARVSDMNTYFITDRQNCSQTLHFTHDEAKVLCWNNTYAEKVSNIKDALTKAVNKEGGYSIYVNSLCGYFVDKTIEQSYIPCVLTDYNANNNNQTLSKASQTAGLQGNIQRFAYTINQMFYDYLQEETDGTGYTPGSMGIILMDRVGESVTVDGKTYDAGNKIPGIIVANNFQHKATTTGYTLRKDQTLEEGDKFAAPAQRGVKGADEGVSIVWE